MKRGKKLLTGTIILTMVVILSINVVSANWFTDIFKIGDASSEGQDGELAAAKPARVDVIVSGTFPAPQIVWMSDLNNKIAANVIAGDRALTAGLDTSEKFSIYAYSPAGPSAFSTTPTAAQVYVTLVYIAASPNQPGGNSRKSTVPCTYINTKINYDTSNDDLSDVGSNIGVVDIVNYSCTVGAHFYDNYGTSPGNWEVRGYIEDSQGHKDGYDGTSEVNCGPATTPSCSVLATHVQPIRKTYYSLLEAIDLNPSTADFGTVGYGDNLDKIPSSDPTVKNWGNINISKIEIRAQDIPESVPADATKFVYSSGFFTDPTTPCATTRNLPDNTLIDTTIPKMIYGALVSSPVKICLDDIPFSANTPAGTYSTATGPGGVAWDIVTTPCTSPLICP